MTALKNNRVKLLDDLLTGNITGFLIDPDGRQRCIAPLPVAVVAGSFHPLHAGHLGLAARAADLLKATPHFELCVCNVDKPPLDADEVGRRVRQLAWKYPIWVTRAATFMDKARLFPGAAFVVGADTAERIVAPRYYAGGASGLHEALAFLRQRGCRFLVAGRKDSAGRFIQLQDLPVPVPFRDLFIEIPPTLFHVDLSSTQLREASNSHDIRKQWTTASEKTNR